MFIYLVAPVATLAIIFGLLHIRYLGTWLRSSIRYPLTLYNGLICRPIVQTSLNNEDFESNLTPEKSVAITSDKFESEYENLLTQKIAISNNERLSDVLLGEDEIKLRNLNLSRQSFENIVLEEKDKAAKIPELRVMQHDTSGTTKQERKENTFESLKNSIEKSNYVFSQLNTRQINNLIWKETLKESEAKQKLLDSDKNEFNEMSSFEIKEHLASTPENKPKAEDTCK
ncbi:hypothetical protein WN48_08079 [Eufriesea mexicana]|uniref:Uncharacterized protein n=1 Tax=Eufriesea mexicana TaxID=516756 RepID=A0A310SBB4_9HYME|nr:hypothetical protein WN48_08079 [Eufriesea mexicana]